MLLVTAKRICWCVQVQIKEKIIRTYLGFSKHCWAALVGIVVFTIGFFILLQSKGGK